MSGQKVITKREEDFSQWYLDIIEAADLAENSAVRGCMVIKPYGYSIWENFQSYLDHKFKELGHQNAYFPLFIPKSYFDKEAKHVEGFAKESAVVTHYRLKLNAETGKLEVDPEAKLEEPLIVRPTSETIIYETFSKWVESYRDLPVLINQWANVVRWEMRTRPFLRTAEFLWQEGHTAHETMKEADAEARQMLEVYQEFAENILAIPVIPGEKSESEKFPGAYKTYTIEAMMQDGKAVQSGTSHNLGDNFAKAFDIKFLDREGKLQHVFQTSWGLSTRMVGALIMTHSDDKGLVLPPRIAPIQAVIVTIFKNEGEEKTKVLDAAKKLKQELEAKGIRVRLDDRDFLTFGEKSFEWEKKGVPVRIELGPRDITEGKAVLVRRDSSEKSPTNLDEVTIQTSNLLEEIQKNLLEKAKVITKAKTVKVENYEEFKKAIEDGHFVLAHWDGTPETEEKIKEETKATIRCIPFDSEPEDGKCVYSGNKSTKRVIFARAY